MAQSYDFYSDLTALHLASYSGSENVVRAILNQVNQIPNCALLNHLDSLSLESMWAPHPPQKVPLSSSSFSKYNSNFNDHPQESLYQRLHGSSPGLSFRSRWCCRPSSLKVTRSFNFDNRLVVLVVVFPELGFACSWAFSVQFAKCQVLTAGQRSC